MTQIIVTATVLLALLIALRYALRGKVSLRLQYALWLLAAVRLLVPVTFGSSPLSVLNAAASVELPYVQYTGDLGPAAPESAAPAVGEGANVSARPDTGVTQSGRESAVPGISILPQAPAEDDLPANTTVLSLSRLLIPLWVTGMAVMAVWLLWVNLDFRARLRRSARNTVGRHRPVPSRI